MTRKLIRPLSVVFLMCATSAFAAPRLPNGEDHPGSRSGLALKQHETIAPDAANADYYKSLNLETGHGDSH